MHKAVERVKRGFAPFIRGWAVPLKISSPLARVAQAMPQSGRHLAGSEWYHLILNFELQLHVSLQIDTRKVVLSTGVA